MVCDVSSRIGKSCTTTQENNERRHLCIRLKVKREYGESVQNINDYKIATEHINVRYKVDSTLKNLGSMYEYVLTQATKTTVSNSAFLNYVFNNMNCYFMLETHFFLKSLTLLGTFTLLFRPSKRK